MNFFAHRTHLRKPILLLFMAVMLGACVPPSQNTSKTPMEAAMDDWLGCVFIDFFEVNGGKIVVPNDAVDKSFDRCASEQAVFYSYVYHGAFSDDEGIDKARRTATAEIAVQQGKEVIRKEILRVISAAQH